MLLKIEMRGRYLREWRDRDGGFSWTLERRMGLRICGVLVWLWWRRVREVPVWEWAKAAIGDSIDDAP